MHRSSCSRSLLSPSLASTATAPRHFCLFTLVIGLGLGLALLPTYVVAQQTSSFFLPVTPELVRNGSARPVAHYDPAKMLRLVIALEPPRMEEEEQFLRQLQDPRSPSFHQYLSQEEWNRRFAPSVEDERAVASWAQAQGLSITHRFANRLLVDVEAPAGMIENALDVTINTYQMGAQSYYSNDRDPSLPVQFAGVVQAVLGLNNIEVAHSLSAKRYRNEEPPAPDYSPGPAYALGPARRGDGDRAKLDEAMAKAKLGLHPFDQFNPYGPADIYGSWAYDYAALQNLGHCCNPLGNPGNSPPESSIAIAIWYDFADSDLSGFLATYPYLAHNVQRYFIDGTSHALSPETTLDVEWTTAMANSFGSSSDTAKVHVYEGSRASFDTLADVVAQILSDGNARVLSISWGASELHGVSRPTINTFHSLFNQLAGQGWSIVVASGDGGATDDCADHLAVSFPASDPNVTAAGGTSLSVSGGAYQGEAAWSGGPYGCANNDGGGGGGCSAIFPGLWYAGNTACGPSKRSLPDIALNADGVYEPQTLFYQGVIYDSGGTSIVAPEIAGFYAQENAYLLYIGNIVGNTCGSGVSSPCSPMGDPKLALYFEALNQPFAAHYPFYDITQGCNGNDITQQYNLTPFCASPGFDQVTGWGSANMLQLAWTINTLLAADFGAPIVTFSGPPINRWYNSDQTVSWNITDTTADGHRAIGVAGFSALWDTDPGDDYSEPTPGSGNSYYSGPAVPNSRGSLDLVAAGLGCHNANVRSWDNAGQPTSDRTYGPVCYDNTPPITIVALSGNMLGQYYQPQVQVTLTATDDLSGIAATYYQIDSGAQQTYTGSFNYMTLGPHTMGYYSIDNAGNVEATQYVNFVVLSYQQNTLTISRTGSGTGNVTSADGSINCGSSCSHLYFDGWPVSLQPIPNPGSVYAGWSGCDSTSGYSCNVVVLSNRDATVTFSQAVPLQFVAVTPCRVVDTRLADGSFGGPPLQGGVPRSFTIPQGPCSGIPGNAAGYSLNITVVPHGSLNYLTVWPTGQPQPVVSTLNSYDGRTKASAAIVPSGTNAAVSVFATDTTDVIVDISGYFVTPNPPATLAYFALPNPCRVVDTRGPQGPLSGPFLSGGAQRPFPILSSSCDIPTTAQVYSFNATVVPHSTLGYLTLWPTGQPQPFVSTLNAPTGTVVANAAIVNSGMDGQIEAYVTDDTDLILDISGYFAPAGSGGNPLSLYALVPCRALDTRSSGGLFSGTLTFSLTQSPCALTSSATAYVLSATVAPQGLFGYLTLWPAGQQQPLTSILNAYDGEVTSNLAIVLSGSGTGAGSISAYASDPTQLILDISSYFGP